MPNERPARHKTSASAHIERAGSNERLKRRPRPRRPWVFVCDAPDRTRSGTSADHHEAVRVVRHGQHLAEGRSRRSDKETFVRATTMRLQQQLTIRAKLEKPRP